jgi:hypothetical protein
MNLGAGCDADHRSRVSRCAPASASENGLGPFASGYHVASRAQAERQHAVSKHPGGDALSFGTTRSVGPISDECHADEGNAADGVPMERRQ